MEEVTIVTSATTKKNIRKISQFYRPPIATVAFFFFNVNANILLKVCDICFWEAERYNEDDEIQIHDALIGV